MFCVLPAHKIIISISQLSNLLRLLWVYLNQQFESIPSLPLARVRQHSIKSQLWKCVGPLFLILATQSGARPGYSVQQKCYQSQDCTSRSRRLKESETNCMTIFWYERKFFLIRSAPDCQLPSIKQSLSWSLIEWVITVNKHSWSTNMGIRKELWRIFGQHHQIYHFVQFYFSFQWQFRIFADFGDQRHRPWSSGQMIRFLWFVTVINLSVCWNWNKIWHIIEMHKM